MADPVAVMASEMTFRQRCGVIGGSVYECDDCCDCSPDYFDYDGPEDFGHCPDVYGFVGPDGYGLCRDCHDLGDCGARCVFRGDAGVMPYESGAGGAVALTRILLPSNRPVRISR